MAKSIVKEFCIMHCLNCKKEILKLGAGLGENSRAIEPGQSSLIEHKGSLSFVRCPHCKARNIFEYMPTPSGQGQNMRFGRFDFD